jgi:endonuclease YncB( thermonuclease family)
MRSSRFSPIRRGRRWRGLDLLTGAAALALIWAIGQEVQRRFLTPETLAGFGEAVDGDSLLLAGQKVRLKGVDAPEMNQYCQNRVGRDYACGVEAKRWLRAQLQRGAVTCRIEGRDRYNRMLGVCAVGQSDLNAAIVREGVAVAYGAYAREEREAQRAQAGLWAGKFATPSEWRLSHPRDHDPRRAN